MFQNTLSKKIGILAEKFLPIYVSFAFLPVISVVFKLLSCPKSIGNDITESYLDGDCSVFCWTGFHLGITIIAIILLMCYIAIAIYCRPLWQRLNEDININTSPSDYMAKSILQMSLILSQSLVKQYNQSLHGVLSGCCVFSYLLYSIKFKPMSYDRCNLWLYISLSMVLWSYTISSLYWISTYKYIPFWIAAQFSGWVFIIALGGCVQYKKYPSLLYAPKGIDISLFFKFALGNSVTADDISSRKTNNRVDDYKIHEFHSQENFISSRVNDITFMHNSKE